MNLIQSLQNDSKIKSLGDENIMNKWNNLMECADFNIVLKEAKIRYGKKYKDKLNEIEREIENYLESSDEA